MFKKVLVPVDGSPISLNAVDTARRLVEEGSAGEVTLLHVAQNPRDIILVEGFYTRLDFLQFQEELMEKVNEIAQQILEKARERLGPEINASTQLENGPPAETICEVADRGNYDLIIIGNRGLNRLQRILLGSVSGKVTSLARCSVLVVK
ncbi:MAG: universal stress protein [Syntrophomonadaceae bacterium]|nr:universal stress protein [Syntrophomonadaceae bacterium]